MTKIDEQVGLKRISIAIVINGWNCDAAEHSNGMKDAGFDMNDQFLAEKNIYIKPHVTEGDSTASKRATAHGQKYDVDAVNARDANHATENMAKGLSSSKQLSEKKAKSGKQSKSKETGKNKR